jgi:hypothetical protein
MNYEKLVEEMLNILVSENIIDDVDWGTLKGNEVINLIKDNKVYSFESKKNSKEIKITIDTLED